MPSSRRPVLSRALAAVALGGAIVAVYAACGFDSPSTSTAVAEGGATEPPLVDGGGGAIDDGGGETGSQTECTNGRTTCGQDCTDLSSDPGHCGTCEKSCAPGENCADGGCNVLCLGNQTACNGTCVDTKSDPANCGGCGKPCTDVGAPFCLNGLCVPDCGDAGGVALCPAVGATPAFCANTATDPKNCGACGVVCKENEVCKGSCVPLCATGTKIGDVFADNMIGCQGKVGFAQRATLCPAGTTVCTAAQWVARRAGKKPTYNYWTDQNLGYYGSDGYCRVDTGNYYYSCNNPMRVCANYTDPLGNRCNWKDCGYQSRTPAEYFGGCQDNTTAGALCCK